MPFRLELECGSRLGLVLGLGTTRELYPRKIAPWLGLVLGVGSNFLRGQLSWNRYFVIVKNSFGTCSCSGSAVDSCSGSWCSGSYSGSAVAV